jgi:penicillin-binding protein A
MNRAIVRLFGVLVLLFAVLVLFTSRWTVFDASGLQNNSLNKLATYASWQVKRGRLVADDGQILARSVRADGNVWNRTYPLGSLFAQLVGYNDQQEGSSAGMEQYFESQLSGPKSALSKVFGSFNGGPQVGDDVYTTLDPKAQTLARELLEHCGAPGQPGGHCTGSVVAIVPQTGAVKVMYSSPSYDDNDPSKYSDGKTSDCAPNPYAIGCTTNLATQGLFPPGSTFKLVTTAAALDSGKYTPETEINGHGPITISGAPLQNDNGEEYGEVSLTTALTDSINVVYAQVGEALGATIMQRYMERFGFYSTPSLQYPSNEMAVSGETFFAGRCRNNKQPLLLPVTDSCVDLGRTAIGQANLTVTPLQMAEVVSAIANDGKLMEPRLATKVVNPDGQQVETFNPTEYDQVIKPKYATELQAMMRDVVEEGTGQTVNFPEMPIAGKTGTASTGGCSNGQPVGGNCPDGAPLDDAWFVGFNEDNPRIAVAVVLENIPNGYGGTYAAPIAAKMIKALLAEDQ